MIVTNGGHYVFALQGKAADKMAAFSVVRKKTPFQKHREEEDAKKRVKIDERVDWNTLPLIDSYAWAPSEISKLCILWQHIRILPDTVIGIDFELPEQYNIRSF